MKKLILFAILLFSINSVVAQTYNDNFTPARLRINLVFAGNAAEQLVYLESMNFEPEWGGSQSHLIDNFDYGEYYCKLFSKDSTLLFSHGFCTLFYEWRFTDEAKQTARAFNVSLITPFPKSKVRLEVYDRNKQTGGWNILFKTEINPDDKQIQRDRPNNYTVNRLLYNGKSSEKVDVVFIAEGYTKDEMQKFRQDAERMADALFSEEPFTSRKKDFNIWALESVSQHSGTDIPDKNIWRNTVANSTFYTFNIDRYLTVPDHSKISEIAWQVPYDILYVIVNTDKYGGAGIYNGYTVGSSDNNSAAAVIVHEFGHSFAGLGDEYAYDEPDAFSDFYGKEAEPWEPNITSLVDFERKWKNMIDKNTPVPTPATNEYRNTTGLFEGAGYSPKGMYRPALGCIMRGLHDHFCPVCQRAVNRMIDYYTVDAK
ncbi:MAG: IgA Peptidase M64 [Dysgonamonadaceae bacterium]|jgi:hypothetical protein|nr:IgA Peptidase M64 [Dysgonamonadaceae bacterium]